MESGFAYCLPKSILSRIWFYVGDCWRWWDKDLESVRWYLGAGRPLDHHQFVDAIQKTCQHEISPLVWFIIHQFVTNNALQLPKKQRQRIVCLAIMRGQVELLQALPLWWVQTSKPQLLFQETKRGYYNTRVRTWLVSHVQPFQEWFCANSNLLSEFDACHWSAFETLEALNHVGFFQNHAMIDLFLYSIVSGWRYRSEDFTYVWNLGYALEFQPNHHAKIFSRALRHEFYPILEFFTTLTNFNISIEDKMQISENPRLCDWAQKHGLNC